MNRSQRWILGAVVLVAALGVWVVMAWPQTGAPAGEDAKTEAGVAKQERASSRALEALRQRARTADAGQVPPGSSTGQGAVFASFGWGGGEKELGRKRQAEGNPEGPMSLALDARGNLTVLDQVNNRLVRMDKTGKVTGTTPLSVQGAQDVAIASDGTTLVLDRSLDKVVSLIGPDGKPVGELKVEGKNLAEGGAATGVFSDGKEVYVEREHGDQVKLGTTDGKADPERGEVPGRLSRDGTAYLTAGISVPGEERVYVGSLEKASRQQRFQREYRLGAPVRALALLDTDRSGVIYLGALSEGAEKRQVVVLLCLDPLDGRPLGRAELPANTSADETFRELVVADEGGVLYLYRTEEKAQIRRYDCR